MVKFAHSLILSLNRLKKYSKRFPLWDQLALTLDRLMSGKFLYLFLFIVAVSTVLFVSLWWICCRLTGWNLGDAFLQLTNPTLDVHQGEPFSKWVAIVVMNLFGLFVINGVVLTLWVNWVSNRKNRHKSGEARYNSIFRKKFSVILGGHKIVADLARELISSGKNDYVLIQTQSDTERLRSKLRGKITDNKDFKRIIIYSGDRVSKHEVEDLNLDLAQEVYIIGESTKIDGTGHDAINMQTWKLINEMYTADKEVRIPCHVMFEYQSTFSAFQLTDLKIEDSRTFRFIPFSIYENWAQQVLIPSQNNGVFDYLPLDGEKGLTYDSCQRVHLIIIGMSKMGMALAVEAAHIAHYPNFNNSEAGHPRILITFIDRNARREMTFFMGRYRELFQLARWRYVKAPEGIVKPADCSWDIYDSGDAMMSRASGDPYRWHDPLQDEELCSPYHGGHLGKDLVDIDFEFLEGDVTLPSVQKYIADACADRSDNPQAAASKTTVAICLPVASEAMSAALYLDPSVYENAQQIWVQQTDSGALVDAIRSGLTGEDNSKYRGLRAFGMLDQCDYLARIHSVLPKLVAYAYDCISWGTTLYDEYSRLHTDELMTKVEANWLAISNKGGKSAIAKRWSNIYCANSFESKMRSASIELSSDATITDSATIKMLAMIEHNRWVMEQILLGLRPLSKDYQGPIPVEDNDEKNRLKAMNIHADIISNAKLGTTKKYDEGIVSIIPTAIALAHQLTQKN